MTNQALVVFSPIGHNRELVCRSHPGSKSLASKTTTKTRRKNLPRILSPLASPPTWCPTHSRMWFSASILGKKTSPCNLHNGFLSIRPGEHRSSLSAALRSRGWKRRGSLTCCKGCLITGLKLLVVPCCWWAFSPPRPSILSKCPR